MRSGRQGAMFGREEVAPVARPAAHPAVPFDDRLDDLEAFAARPEGWRAPTEGEHPCTVCAGAACYGVGFTATVFYCRCHAPPELRPGRVA